MDQGREEDEDEDDDEEEVDGSDLVEVDITVGDQASVDELSTTGECHAHSVIHTHTLTYSVSCF